MFFSNAIKDVDFCCALHRITSVQSNFCPIKRKIDTFTIIITGNDATSFTLLYIYLYTNFSSACDTLNDVVPRACV